MKHPSWFSPEMINLCQRQGLTEDQAYERIERLAIQEEGLPDGRIDTPADPLDISRPHRPMK
jgi:hypothetical protein